MRGGFIFFLTLILLLALVAAANQALANLHVYVFAGGLFTGLAAGLLPFGPGFAAVFAAGLACDANAGVPFGTHALLFALVHCVLFHFRDRLPHDEAFGRVLICLACNMALFIALTLQRAYRAPSPAGEGFRVGYDFLFSQIAVAAAGPWFYHLQRRALALTRAGPGRSLL